MSVSMINTSGAGVGGSMGGGGRVQVRVHNVVDTVDAALSLCALGLQACTTGGSSPRRQDSQPSPNETKESFNRLTIQLPTQVPMTVQSTHTAGVVTPTPSRSPSMELMPQSIANTDQVYNILDLLPNMGGAKQRKTSSATATGGVGITRRMNIMKAKDPKRDTSVSFEEMKRLMRVYGPTKALRGRAAKDSKSAKPDSIRRKFYRWFPDFSERFAKTSGGWWAPKAGHEEEMVYRASMRKMDQEKLVNKRNDKRYNYGLYEKKDRMCTHY